MFKSLSYVALVSAVAIVVFSTLGLAIEIPLYEQSPISIGNPATDAISIFSTVSDDPQEPRAKTWDNFTLQQDAEITAIQWMGTYNNVFNANDALRGEINFQVEVFANTAQDAPDLSQALHSFVLDAGMAGIDDGTVVSKSIAPDAFQADGGIVVDYAAEVTPFSLSAGNYWLSIVAEQTLPSPHPDDDPGNPDAHLDPIWGWVQSSGGDNLLYQFDQQYDASEPGFRFTAESCPVQACDATFSLVGIPPVTGVWGDFNGTAILDVQDINLLSAAIRDESNEAIFDINADGTLDHLDHEAWVSDAFGTWFGDADLDSQVSFADFLALSANFGQTGGWSEGDFDGDNQVQFSDFLRLAGNFGSQAPQTEVANVPEPTFNVVYMMLCFAGAVASVKRRQS